MPTGIRRKRAWPVQGLLEGGWRLHLAWCYSQLLVLGGLAWLYGLLRAREAEGIQLADGSAALAFWRTYLVSLFQSFFVQDVVKVLLFCFISPAFLSNKLPCCRPGGRLFKPARICLRGVFNSILPLL